MSVGGAATAADRVAPVSVLMLLLEPTPYIVPRALIAAESKEFNCDVVFTLRESSQNWGKDAEIGSLPVLLDKSIPWTQRLARVARLIFSLLRGDYKAAHLAGWGHWVMQLAILSCKMRGIPFSVESDTQMGRESGNLKRFLKRELYPILMRWPSEVVPGGTRQARLFRHYGVPEDRIHIAHMTVDTNRIRTIQTEPRESFRAGRGIGPDDVVALYVGRLEWYKGVRVLLEGFERAHRESPRLKLTIVGDGTLMPEVVEFRKRMGDSTVILAGRERYERVIQWMRSSEFLVLPSLREQWGLVVNEAMTCGLPVVVSDACGCVDDLVIPDRNGVVFRTGESADLANAMTLVAGSAQLRDQMRRESDAIIAPWSAEHEGGVITSVLRRMAELQ